MIDLINKEIVRLKKEGTYGVISEEAPEVQGIMYAIFSKEDGGLVAGHFICKHTPEEFFDEFLAQLKSL